MKNLFEWIVLKFAHFLLWFRYKISFKGVENLNKQNLSKPGGVLFIPNHPCVVVDPTAVTIGIWKKYPLRHLIVEYMYYTPGVHFIMSWLNAIPVPNNEVSSNLLKRKRSEKAFTDVIQGLKNGENFLIYPAGKLKETAKEIVGGASGVHRILREAPETNVVLVRTTGLWGSSLSKAFTGVTPPLFPALMTGIKACLKNFIFFMPRRKVTVEYVPAPADFPYNASRLELNRWLENWYNRPDGLSPATTEYPGETLNLVSFSRWKEVYPETKKVRISIPDKIDISQISPEVQKKILTKLSEMTERPKESIKPEMDISLDLGMDSLDVAEVLAYVEDEFDITGIPVNEITTVLRIMGIADKKILIPQRPEQSADLGNWNKPVKEERIHIAEGKTVSETFLNSCKTMGKAAACGDDRSGVLTYADMKLRAIILAEKIKQMPGQYIGILLPSSVAAILAYFACQLAGKVPVMINWTVGVKHLQSVCELTEFKTVLSSWAFLDRLVNVDLTPLESKLIMLEDLRREIGVREKIKALLISKKSTEKILRHFGSADIKPEAPAVYLFTSGTENMPKGVPLSHYNLLSNQRAVLELFELYSNDILLSILPPFHSFGLTVSGTLGILAGMRVAYFPDPTDGRRVAKSVEHWKASIMIGAPTFLKNMLRAAEPGQLKTLRCVVTGAEKAPPDLFTLMDNAGLTGTLLEGYGITECSPVLTMNMFKQEPKGVGRPLNNVELLIVHPETYEKLALGEQGLILARGPNVFSGYLNKGVAAPFLEVDGKSWYITGDLGFLDEKNRLTISGRLKRFIKIGGEMISLAIIEDTIHKVAIKKGWEIPEEGAALAISAKEIPDEKPKIVLFSRFPISVDDINVAIREEGIGNLVRITAVKQVEEIPLMGTGKVNYRELEAQYLSDT